MSITTGGCLCGTVRFEVHGTLPPIQVCHCHQCQKANGSAFAAAVPVKVEQLRFLGGRDQVREYESSPGKFRAFCTRCGSPVYSRRPDTPDAIRLRAGTLDPPFATQPVAHFHVASKAGWYTIADGLPQFEAGHVPRNEPSKR